MSNATPIQGHYDTSSVFVAVIGRPNVGKSSLTNLLVGEKVAIVTSKPQTTRTRITGVITRGPLQYVLLDTPGVHKARNKLGKRMDKTASDSIADVDVSMMLFEPYGALNESEMVLVDMLRSSGGPAIAVINKTDLVKEPADLEARKAELKEMTPVGARVRLIFLVPSRGLFGYRNEFLTDTRGEGIMSTVFEGYEPYKGDIPTRNFGSLIAFETGEALTYGLFYAQDRGTLFCGPNTAVYTGMIVGQNARQGDIDVNVCRQKHLTSIRNAAGAETAMKLTSMRTLTLEECLEFIDDDELVEITPKSIRMRKKILGTEARKKLASKQK